VEERGKQSRCLMSFGAIRPRLAVSVYFWRFSHRNWRAAAAMTAAANFGQSAANKKGCFVTGCEVEMRRLSNSHLRNDIE
jgi:hypothetical protein